MATGGLTASAAEISRSSPDGIPLLPLRLLYGGSAVQRASRTSPHSESRLTIAKCRALLGQAAEGLSDSEVESVRDQFYAMARVAANAYVAGKRSLFGRAVSELSAADRYGVEERAAILQFDGRLLRDDAERLAIARHIRPIKPS